MNQTKSFNGGNGKGMRKAAHPSGGMGHGFIKSTSLEGLAASPSWWWCLLGDLCFLCAF
jgi:hypothetical protein